ncbi:ABC transporter substrate-binding protein [Leekyejoonella antrihumi]|uniref:ABC transporter substrate-binding protein n=1 Tax=Leekyejoonella antrihumi TaxID=1660198 RepID=A0A563DWS8_9MICO|nr:ABC transporter substrate-binding protein [Leekyejoonella antrihumi]TWP34677.1 ABC transporter substrate-binding protein [Leekyejoonella antrihumi]
MKTVHWKLAASSVTVAVLLSACGSSGSGNAASGTSASAKVASIKVGVLPLADYAPVYWAKDHGFFKKEGLDVTFQTLQGGPVGVQEVATGQLQFSFSNTISSSIATSKGAPVQTVALVSGLGVGELGIFVKPNSPIKTLSDLNGKTVGINTLNNVGDVSFANLAKAKGLNAKPSWVEVPFPQMIDGVKNGSIQAGYLPEPFATAAKDAGLREVAPLVTGPNEALPVSTFVTSTNYAKSDPGTVKKFATALNNARADIAKHQKEFRAWMPKALGTNAKAAKAMNLPNFDVKLSDAAMQKIADIMIGLGQVKKGYQASAYTIVNEK